MNPAWASAAQRVFDSHPSVATVSIVSRGFLSARSPGSIDSKVVLADSAVWPVCYVNRGVADLIGAAQCAPDCAGEELQRVAGEATRRGLQHAWLVMSEAAELNAQTLVSGLPHERSVICALDVPGLEAVVRPIALGIDASWLLSGESGAQVFVFEMLKAMARLEAIGSIVLLSDSGAVPQALAGVPKISGLTWNDALAQAVPLDILHRPYQPGVDTDFSRYRRIARAVALTVLDFIAYDNPAYHESAYAFRQYRRAFDDRVCAADRVFAISAHVGVRLQRQFAHRLIAPVQSIYLGTDHLDAVSTPLADAPTASVAGVASKAFVVVLGNDFAHKNRDFAVKAFAQMCRKGYPGQLLLAGFHLDAGSSYGYELDGAGEYADRIVRTGALSPQDKVWALQHADVVLYPTSSEGFGLIPFEAAALGTPTAFVRFGPLAETLQGVPAAAQWSVDEFAELALSLVCDPAPFLDAVAEARRRLSWEECARRTTDAYRELLSERAPQWSVLAADHAPGQWQLLGEAAAEYTRRVRRRVTSMVGRFT